MHELQIASGRRKKFVRVRKTLAFGSGMCYNDTCVISEIFSVVPEKISGPFRVIYGKDTEIQRYKMCGNPDLGAILPCIFVSAGACLRGVMNLLESVPPAA